VGQHDHADRRGIPGVDPAVIGGLQRASQERPRPDHTEEVPGDDAELDLLRIARVRQVGRAEGVDGRHRPRERCHAIAHVQIVGRRQRSARGGFARGTAPDQHQAVAVGIRQAAQQHAVDDREDRCCHRDADAERGHGEQRGNRRSHDAAENEGKVVAHLRVRRGVISEGGRCRPAATISAGGHGESSTDAATWTGR
jgi:hypothetical protein